MCHFSNPIVNLGSEVQPRCVKQSGAEQCSWSSQLLTHHLLNKANRLMYSIWHVELDMRFVGCWLSVIYTIAGCISFG